MLAVTLDHPANTVMAKIPDNPEAEIQSLIMLEMLE